MTPKRILVIDDEPDLCEALQDLLTGMGYEVVTVLTGEDGLTAYRQHRPDVVLLDVSMPGMGGIETLKELKALDPEATIVMLTAIAEEQLGMQARAEGALEYFTKPINPTYIELALRTIIASKQSG